MGWVKVIDRLPSGDKEYDYRFNHSEGRASKSVLEQWKSRGFYDVEWLDDEPNYKEILESAIQLIKNIRHGNIYKDPVDACANFLIEHGYEKI